MYRFYKHSILYKRPEHLWIWGYWGSWNLPPEDTGGKIICFSLQELVPASSFQHFQNRHQPMDSIGLFMDFGGGEEGVHVEWWARPVGTVGKRIYQRHKGQRIDRNTLQRSSRRAPGCLRRSRSLSRKLMASNPVLSRGPFVWGPNLVSALLSF